MERRRRGLQKHTCKTPKRSLFSALLRHIIVAGSSQCFPLSSQAESRGHFERFFKPSTGPGINLHQTYRLTLGRHMCDTTYWTELGTSFHLITLHLSHLDVDDQPSLPGQERLLRGRGGFQGTSLAARRKRVLPPCLQPLGYVMSCIEYHVWKQLILCPKRAVRITYRSSRRFLASTQLHTSLATMYLYCTPTTETYSVTLLHSLVTLLPLHRPCLRPTSLDITQ